MLNLLQPPSTPSILSETPAWVSSLIAVAGGWGLLLIAFVDSSFFTLPIINDILVIWFSVENPSRWIFYSSMASLGSILGSLVIYYFSRKGGEVLIRKRLKGQAKQIERVHRWLQKNEFLAIAIPAVMPPPTPFKIFIMAAGAFQVRLPNFLVALALGRGVRYFMWGFLGAYFGKQALEYLQYNFLQISGIAISLILAGYLLARLAERLRRPRPSAG